MKRRDSSPVRYADAGVDIDAGNLLVNRIKPHAAATHRAGVMPALGGFGATFRLGDLGLKDPLLVATTDGVGTKLKLAQELGDYRTIGIDLVAMCVNDLVVQGAEPLFFLDYYACGQLEIEMAEQVIAGIARGCKLAGAALVGGETAEMPGLYQDGDYDLAGFAVGVVEADQLVDGCAVHAGDSVIGLGSDGVHANGFSLVRRIIENSELDLGIDFAGESLGKTLLRPTRIYARAVLALLREVEVHAMAHITGGGLVENIPRVLPDGHGVVVDASRWQAPAEFEWLRQAGPVADDEMLRTFNCGVGFVVIVPAAATNTALDALHAAGERATRIGEVVSDPAKQVVIEGFPATV